MFYVLPVGNRLRLHGWKVYRRLLQISTNSFNDLRETRKFTLIEKGFDWDGSSELQRQVELSLEPVGGSDHRVKRTRDQIHTGLTLASPANYHLITAASGGWRRE